MRYFIYLTLIVAGLSSCSRYQYLTVNSSQLTKNDNHQLVFENDTVRLTYDFNGKDGPISLNIFNKTDQPLYVNWKKSALIRDEHPVSYFDRDIQFSGGSESYGVRFGRFAGSASSFSGSFALPEGIAFVPPGSAISKGLVYISQSGPTTLEFADSIPQQAISDAYGTSTVKYRQKTYDETQSPMRFKSYMIFMLGLNSTQEFAETCNFYIGEAVDTRVEPDLFPYYKPKGDNFFIQYKKQQ